jgi:signal transduction histidine kinase
MASAIGSGTSLVYLGLFGVAALACLAALPRAVRVEDRETRYGLVGLLVGSGGWAGSHAGLFLAPTAGLTVASYMVGLVLGFSTVFSWLYFASAYTGRGFHRRPRLRLAGLGLYVGVVAVKLTNPIHGQYFSVDPATAAGLAVDIQQGTFHWLATGLAYALAAVGLFMLFEQFHRAGYDTRPLTALTAVTALPIVFDLAGFAGDLLLNVIYAPVGVAAFALGVLYVHEDRFLAVQLTGDIEEAFVFVDDDGRIRDFNDRALALFSWLSGARGETLASVSESDLADGTVVEAEGDGETRYVLVSSSAFSLGQSDIGEVVMFTDVTEIETQRRELQRHNAQLEEFASGIRHELRNSLQVIGARVNAAGDALDDGRIDGARESLRAASDRTERMSRTVTDLATLAQYGQTIGTTRPTDFRAVVEEAWAGTDTGERSLTVEGDGTVTAEPSRLRGLFEGAFEFVTHNEATAVTVTLGEEGFTITDDGTAPSDGDVDKLFDYGQAVPSAEAGMALPNVRTLARVHGWTVTVDTGYGDGFRLVVEGVTVETPGEAATARHATGE